MKANTIAEMRIKNFLAQNFNMNAIKVEMYGRAATVTDVNGDNIEVVYDADIPAIYVKES